MRSNQLITYPRGSVFWINNVINPSKSSSVQSKRRPVVIVSNDERGRSTIVEVCTITHADKSNVCPDINIRFLNDKGEYNYVQCNQHFTVNIKDLTEFVGILPPDVMFDVDSGLLIAQGMGHLVDANEKISELNSRIEDLTSRNVSSKYIERMRTALIDSCKQFNDLVSSGNSKVQKIQETLDKSKEPKEHRKYMKWTDDNMLDFLCDCESDLTDEELMSKWNIKDKSSISKKVAYVKKKLGM